MILQNAVRTIAKFYCPGRVKCLELLQGFIIDSGGKLLSEIYLVRTEPFVTVQYTFGCEGDFSHHSSRESVLRDQKNISDPYVSFHPWVKSEAPTCIGEVSLASNALIWILALRDVQCVFITKPVAEQYQSPSAEPVGCLLYPSRAFLFQVVASLH